jgi:hypothetical protein
MAWRMRSTGSSVSAVATTGGSHPATGLLLGLVEPLEEVLRGKAPKDFEDWTKQLLIQLTKDMNRERLCDLMNGFGWDDLRVTGEPRLRDLAKTVRGMLIEQLTPHMVEMLTRWKRDGMFDVATRRRRMHPRDRQDTRDRATTPRYTPPGRT